MPDPMIEARSDQVGRLQKRLARERAARFEAETIAEKGLRELYERQQEILLLERIAAAANQSRSVPDVLAFALEQVCAFMHWSIGHAYIAERRGGQTVLCSTGIWHATDADRAGAFRAVTDGRRFASGEGLPGRVHATGAPVWVFDVSRDDAFPRLRSAAECGLRAGCAFPILVGSEVAAVLEFFTTTALDEDAGLLALMSQIGMQLGRVLERRRAEERLIHDASHDPLTGLPNRALFLERLNQAVDRHRADAQARFAVLFIDLDRFKIVNDSLGHLAGDRLIFEAAARLRETLRREAGAAAPAPAFGAHDPDRAGGHILARLGGDEFTVLLTGIAGADAAVAVADRILAALRQPFVMGDREVYSSASIGIATSDGDHAGADDILRNADLAMYRAKAAGKARSELFDEEMHRGAMKRLALESDLRRALANEEFVLHYQPIVSLTSHDIVGLEALVRWQPPGQKLVFPGEFIDVAEDTGLILGLGMWVLREACRTLRRWHAAFPHRRPLMMSINLSPRQFAQADLVAQVSQAIAETGIEARCVRLEITESVTVGDAGRVSDILSALKRIGVRLSIDDFGTGYSSLSYLHRFPLDVLKIDRSFISGMDQSAESFQVVQTIMNLARNLRMDIVAEGTETAAQVALLRAMGCDFAQGYFFSKPVDAPAVEAMLRADGAALGSAAPAGSVAAIPPSFAGAMGKRG